MTHLSIIIPTLNEAATIEYTLKHLAVLIKAGHEVIIVDGGSTDATLSICKKYTQCIVSSEKGRAKQMNVGVEYASNKIIVFLHADTFLPIDANLLIAQALKSKQWGFFCIRLSGSHLLLRLIEFFMNIRSRLTGIATGDQVIFMQKDTFKKIGGFREIPLMEDIEISRALKKFSTPACICQHVISSSRRWETQGFISTIFLMWKLRLFYFFGVPASQLVKKYYK
ncbi:MAG TPA: glycosyltransferase [Gammaproteobacteria bacterium]|nr:glycosyltransferase [Gammaproteobacteria bacterium]